MKKIKFDKMLELFDKMWENNKGSILNTVIEWPNTCESNGWTSEDFDKALNEYSKTNSLKS